MSSQQLITTCTVIKTSLTSNQLFPSKTAGREHRCRGVGLFLFLLIRQGTFPSNQMYFSGSSVMCYQKAKHLLESVQVFFHSNHILKRERQFLKTQLNGTYDMLVISYPTGMITWPKETIKATDIKTRKPPFTPSPAP